MRIPPDSGLQYIDQNAFFSPRYPLEPLFRAVYSEKPQFDVSAIDLVTDRNNLRKLLGAITGDPKRFRIDVQLLGRTLLFDRWEENSVSQIPPNAFRGFRRNFEMVCIRYDHGFEGVRDQTGIIKYRLCGLEILLRFKVDGYLSGDTAVGATSNRILRERADFVLFVLEGLGLRAPPRGSAIPGSDIQIIQAGSKVQVPHSSLLGIKTRSQRQPARTDDIIRQLWLAQVSHFISAHYHKGEFIETEEKDFGRPMYGPFAMFERSEGNHIRKLVQVLERLRRTMIEKKVGKGILIFENGRLQLHNRTNSEWEILPADLLSKWD